MFLIQLNLLISKPGRLSAPTLASELSLAHVQRAPPKHVADQGRMASILLCLGYF